MRASAVQPLSARARGVAALRRWSPWFTSTRPPPPPRRESERVRIEANNPNPKNP